MAIHRTAARPNTLTRRQESTFRRDVLQGLRSRPRTLPCKYLYDERGSALFDKICDLPEYYLTRTELEVLHRDAPAMAKALGPQCLIIEFGSGSSIKTPLLLEQLESPAGYVPVDISREHLMTSAKSIASRFPAIEVQPVCADFTKRFELPAVKSPVQRRVVYFPGSTIGNFGPDDAITLMKGIADLVGHGGALLVGVDLYKSADIIEPAYNDTAGITAAFNLNLLERINRDLDADFQPEWFEHRAWFNEEHGRIEMYLISRRSQQVRIGDKVFHFTAGEGICTEHSYKYRRAAFAAMAGTAGFTVREVWTDTKGYFSVQLLVAE